MSNTEANKPGESAGELLPCPFDGRDAFVQKHTSTSGSMTSWQVRCARCGVGGEVWGDKAKAIRAWNTRPAGSVLI